FDWLRPHHVGQRLAQAFVVAEPGATTLEVRLDRIAGPVRQLLLDQLARTARLQAQRVAAEVDLLLILLARDMEALAEGDQRVGGVLGDGPDFSVVDGHRSIRFVVKLVSFSRRRGKAGIGLQRESLISRLPRDQAKREAGRPSQSSAVPWKSRERASSPSPSDSMPLPGSCSPSGNG